MKSNSHQIKSVSKSEFLIRLVGGLFASFVLVWSSGSAEAVIQDPDTPKPGTKTTVAEWLETQGWWWLLKEQSSPLPAPLDSPTLSQRLREALAQREALDRARQGGAPQAQSLSPWTNIGPAHITSNCCAFGDENAGRILALAVDPANSSHWLITASTGGIWQTTDGGNSWSPQTDDQSSFNMASDSAAIAFAPGDPNTVYAGAFAAGLLKSTNGGNTWTVRETNVFGGRGARAFLVSPASSNIVVAAVDTLYGANSTYGIYRTTDGGSTWTQKLKYAASDLVSVTGDFTKQYAAIGQLVDFQGDNGLYRSTDSGENWQHVAGPWDGHAGRIALAFAPSNSSLLYVVVEDGANPFSPLGIWKSQNAWDPTPSWAPLPVPSGFGIAFGRKLSVDPANADDLYADGGHLYKYHNGVWTDLTDCATHTDSWEIAWVDGDLLVTNDGGIFRSPDKGATFDSRNTDLPIAQFYPGGAIHPTSPNLALGGTQDDATAIYGGLNTPPTRIWRQFCFTGDGMANAISVVSPDTHWLISGQWMTIYHTTDGGVSWNRIDGPIEGNGRPFITRFASCPSADVVITGTTHLWRSDNAFTAGQPTWNLNNLDIGGNPGGMTFARSDPTCGTYAVGAGGGNIWATTNGGTSWAQIGPANQLPARFVTSLAFDPQNARKLYATLSGFDQDTPGHPGHVFVCNDITNPSWVNISGQPSLNAPHNAIAVDPGNNKFLAVGTNVGVLTSPDSGTTWYPVPSNQVPPVLVFGDNDIQINRNTMKIVVFTYGRGAYSANIIPDTMPKSASFQSQPATVRSLRRYATVPGPGWFGMGILGTLVAAHSCIRRSRSRTRIREEEERSGINL
jgi:photosystem II stability/assembly factor-like uncharacterized protein